jgi:NAD(P)H-hydrate epimerase
MIVAGSNRYIGAAFLAGAAAYAAGTGLVSIATPENLVPTLAAMLPEAIWLPLPHENGMLNSEAVAILQESLLEYSALLVGPGLGHNPATHGFLVNLLKTIAPNTMGHDEMPRMVIDADGLNILATLENWWQRLPPRTIITPHPGEFSRLAAYDKENAPSTTEIQSDRVAVARRYAAIWNCVVVLKGPYTISTEPEGRTTVNPFASSALATAGTGDVLAGTIAGLLAQGMAAPDAAIAGAWLHGYAGHYAEDVLGTPIAVKASDVLAYLANAFQALNSVTP